jgi:hypothetical protein
LYRRRDLKFQREMPTMNAAPAALSAKKAIKIHNTTRLNKSRRERLARVS